MPDQTRKAPDQGPSSEAETPFSRAFSFARAPRRRLMALTVCRYRDIEVTGYTLNISYTGLLVQCISSLPEVGDRYEISVLLPLGELRARGKVSRVDESDLRFAVELTHIAKNGYLILAGFLADVGTGGRIRLARRL